MAGASLLALIDDIASVLDDVALLTKVAAKKTSGVLGDDLALNAQQVIGVRADRELPIVWAVCKGSFLNKIILVPLALSISSAAPGLVTPLLMIGGAYLCFEGFEKIWHTVFHKKSQHGKKLDKPLAPTEPNQQILVAAERNKIKGAIRTDFILSAEIIAITLGTVQESTFVVQTSVLSGVAVLMTIGVYGFVAIIVKIDDMGLYMVNQGGRSWFLTAIGTALLKAAPLIMKFLSIAGTAAMFFVGGGIFKHGLPWLLTIDAYLTHTALKTMFDAVIGIFVGIVSLSAVSSFQRIKKLSARDSQR